MKIFSTKLLLVLALLCTGAVAARANSTAFTYQGRLITNGTPATGSYDFRFAHFAVESGGSPAHGPVSVPAVRVTNGVFTAAIDFGEDAFNGIGHWLEISVRRAGGTTFTTLTPRQPITPVPYALTAVSAMNVPGISGSALHSPNGGPPNVVVADPVGKVGVGTTVPLSQFHVASKPNESPPRLQAIGTGDFSAGWDFYHGSVGKGYVGVPGSGAGIAPGELILFGGQDTKVSLWSGGVRGVMAHPSGAVTIGTDVEPFYKFEVNGDARVWQDLVVDGEVLVGRGGFYRAASGEESLRIVRGHVHKDGSVAHGSGFRATRLAKGVFDIQFDGPFAGAPAFTATADYDSYTDLESVTVLMLEAPRAGAVRLRLQYPGGTLEDADFSFIAIGPR